MGMNDINTFLKKYQNQAIPYRRTILFTECMRDLRRKEKIDNNLHSEGAEKGTGDRKKMSMHPSPCHANNKLVFETLK